MARTRQHQHDQAAPRDNSPVSPAAVRRLTTGLGVPASVFRERTKREQLMLDGDNLLAEKLHGQPIPLQVIERRLQRLDDRARIGDPEAAPEREAFRYHIDAFQGRRLTWLGDVTGRAVNLSALRDINMFESVMTRHRAFYLKALEHFGADHPARRHFRYAVITTRRRLRLGDNLAGFKSEMMAKISEWSRHIRKEWDIEVLLNVVEYTFDKDSRTFFVHFNVLLWPHRKLDKTHHWEIETIAEDGRKIRTPCPRFRPGAAPVSEWQQYLRWSWQFLGVHWQDNAKIQDFKEVIKYCLKGHEADPDKPGEKRSVDPRREMTTPESVWLYGQLYRQRFIVPYGSLRAHIAALRENRQKLAYLPDPGTGQKRLRVVQLDELPDTEPDESEPDEEAVKETENIIRGRK